MLNKYIGVQNYFIQSVGVIFTLKAHSRGASVPFGLSHIARYDPLRFPRYRGTETLTRRKHLRPENALSM